MPKMRPPGLPPLPPRVGQGQPQPEVHPILPMPPELAELVGLLKPQPAAPIQAPIEIHENMPPDPAPTFLQEAFESMKVQPPSPEPPQIVLLEPLTDIVAGLIPARRTHLFSGAPGAGKTTTMAWMLAQILAGGTILGRQCRRPAEVGIIATDRQWGDYAAILEKLGIANVVKYHSFVDDPALTGKRVRGAKKNPNDAAEDRFDLLRYCVAQLFQTPLLPRDSLIILDVIGYFLGGDLMDYDRVFSYMLDLNKFCHFAEVTIVGIAHAGKQKLDPKSRYTRPQDRIVGTTAQTGGAGTTMYLASPSETGGFTELTVAPRSGPPATYRMDWTDQGLLVPVSDEPIDPLKAEQEAEIAGLGEKAQQVLTLIPYTTDESYVPLLALQKRAGLPKTTFYRVIAHLVEIGALAVTQVGKEKHARRLVPPQH